jgi:HK97 family phage major capsid protein
MTAKELRVSRATLINQARDLSNKESATTEDLASVDRMLAEVDVLQAKIDRAEKIDNLGAELAREVSRSVARGDRAEPVAADAHRIRNISAAIVAGRKLSDEDKSIVADVKARDFRILAAMGAPGGEYSLAAADREHLATSYKPADPERRQHNHHGRRVHHRPAVRR